MDRESKKIWIDLDNSPHVPFFIPIIQELIERGYSVLVTARDCFQVCGLADLHKLPYKRVGRHYGKNKFVKMVGLMVRALQLAPTVVRARPCMAISHGSRSQMIAARLLGIPSVVVFDYEFVKGLSAMRPVLAIMPEVIPDSTIPKFILHVAKYSGIKEDVYVPFFKPQSGLLEELGIDESKVIVTVRPPATEAHYHKPESDVLFKEAVEWLSLRSDVVMVLLPRNDNQAAFIKETWPSLVDCGKLIIPDHVVDGLNLIWYSDLVISGGGTMNREAAALSVPVYSIFRGKIGAVDNYLAEQGRLVLVETVEDIQKKISVKKRDGKMETIVGNSSALYRIVSAIEESLAIGDGSRTIASCTALTR